MCFYYEIAPIKIVRSGSDILTYSSAEELEIGQIVEIPVGKKNLIGVVWRKAKKPGFETREILKIISKTPIPKHLIKLSKWLSEYYATPLAQVLSGILPSGLNKSRRVSKSEKL